MDNMNKKVISTEKVNFEVPPNREELSKMDHSERESGDSELMMKAMSLGVNRSQIEAINDIDKQKRFMIDEILRLDPPFPKRTQPVLVDTKYAIRYLVDTKYLIGSMEKVVTYKYVKHIITEGGVYSHSIISIEEYKLPMENRELDNYTKNCLEDSIIKEINALNINDYNSKQAIMGFACDNGKSSGEKRKRMIMLQNRLKNELGSDYKHRRITNYEISTY
jgi:hypothetical protein